MLLDTLLLVLLDTVLLVLLVTVPSAEKCSSVTLLQGTSVRLLYCGVPDFVLQPPKSGFNTVRLVHVQTHCFSRNSVTLLQGLTVRLLYCGMPNLSPRAVSLFKTR